MITMEENMIVIEDPETFCFNFDQRKCMIVIKDAKTFCFNFDCCKDVDESLEHEVEFIIKSNESLTDN